MKRFFLIIFVAALAGAGGWFAAIHKHASSTQASDADTGTIYTCSMHPQVRSPKPGKCPFCGMELVALNQLRAAGLQNGVMLNSNRINAINVQTEEARRQPLQRTLRVAGTIDDNDSTHRFISAYIDGRIDKLFVNFVGAEVTNGQPLATFYSPMLLAAEREYVALAAQKFTNSGAELKAERDRLVAGAAQRLKQLGLSQEQIASLADKPAGEIRTQILAPISGTVVARNIYEGQYVKEGEKLFEIADFSVMWFKFDAYERDLPWLRVGQSVEITTPAAPGKVYTAPIVFIDPNINDPTRSARVRVEIPNALVSTNRDSSRRELFHKTFAEGIVKVEIPEVLAVPRTAVLATGRRTLVYIDKGAGLYEQRSVRLGRPGDDLWEILDGLKEGDRVVTTGNMLIDAQAQLDLGGSFIPAEIGKPMPEFDQNQQKSLSDFLAVADGISRSLASDNLSDYNNARARLSNVVETLQKSFSSAPVWQPLIDRLAETIPAEAAIDLGAARKDFLPFTTAAVDLARTARKQDAFRTVKIYKCPMAPKPGQTSFWLQLQGPLRNPFYGADMVDCGSEVGP